MNQPLLSTPTKEEPARFSVAEFMAMTAQGPLADNPGKIELADGVILRMNPPNFAHSIHQASIFRRLDRALSDNPGGPTLGFEISVRLNDDTVRVPDIALFRDPGTVPDILDGALLLLVVEIADSSLAVDLGPKRLSYAAAGVPHYWVVDIVNRRVHRMRAPLDGDYAHRELSAFGDALPVPETDRIVAFD